VVALAERVEALTEASREVDFEIWFMRRDKEQLWSLSGMNAQRPLWTEDDLKRAVQRFPAEYGFGARFTASLDAAMTLVPKSDGNDAYFWTVGHDGEGPDPSDFKARVLHVTPFVHKQSSAVAATPALALTAACLRARALASEPR
jgi:hypothetical protein